MKKEIIHQLFFLLVLLFGTWLSWCSQIVQDDFSGHNHYARYLNKEVTAKIILKKQLKTTKTNKRFYANVQVVNDTIVSGKLLVETPIEFSKKSELQVGDVLICKTTLRRINKPVSPYNFNYKSYLSKQHIYAKIKLKKNYIKVGHNTNWLIKLQKVRNYATTVLDNSSLSKNTIGLMKAMLLGDREGVTDEMLTSFTNAGVVHIIAISGMHVGVLYFMLLYTFSFIKRFKYGDYIYVIIVILFLWSFAVFSGLSSSVIRSVTMFSFFTLAKLKRGKRLVLEAVVTSMLILLLVDVNYIYNLGFQLSYIAVISIVAFYPLLTKWVKVKNKITQYFIDVLIVSIIAQLGVLPLSLYYFHQIPLQFLIANFFAVSLLPIVLYGGIVVLIKVLFTINNSFIEVIYDEFITFYLNVLQYISSFSNYILKDITFKETEIIYYYVFLFCVWYVFKSFTIKRIKLSLCLIIVCQVILITEKFYKQENSELLIYNNYFFNMVTIREGKEIMIFSRDSLSKKEIELLTPNKIKNNVKEIRCIKDDVFSYKKEVFLILNKNKPYYLLTEKGMNIILVDNPKINLERLLINLKPKEVIITNSNYKSNQLKWKSTCNKLQVPSYSILELGYYKQN